MPVQVTFSEEQQTVQKAIDFTNNLLNDDEFYHRIKEKNSFDLSTATPEQVADLLRASVLIFNVEFFYPNFLNFKYRKTFAYTDGNYPNRLFLNYKKLNRSSESITATIIHESIHAVDNNETQYTFGHGNNSPIGKENTAPYWIGNLAYSILTGNQHFALLQFDQEEPDIA
ncbi:MAG TPA: hypothetical protein VFW07_00670 [Parafilimonas sp.]|nr:hypothetical protein [Parafilimonas sp.]